MFLNLSNHPSSGWSQGQLAAAESLGGAILDEPFPEVPPEADGEEVRRLGADVVDRVLPLAPAGVMVQGEFTLAFYLVTELQLRGIPCYAATTRRISVSIRLPDGGSQTRANFEFVRFRRYL